MSLLLQTKAALVTVAAVASAAVSSVALQAPASAEASSNQLALFAEAAGLQSNPTGTLKTLRQLGVGAVRLPVRWQDIAPDATSAARPKGFDATNPAAYPAAAWTRYDGIMRDAQADGTILVTHQRGPRFGRGGADRVERWVSSGRRAGPVRAGPVLGRA